MKKLFPILTIVFTMAFGSVNASTFTNLNPPIATVVNPVQISQVFLIQDIGDVTNQILDGAQENLEDMGKGELASQMQDYRDDMAGNNSNSTSNKNNDKLNFHQELKKRFIEGGPGFMGIVLLCLILGLAIAIERIIFLNLSTTNTKRLIEDVEGALSSGGVEAAKEVCRNTKGPIASIFYQGLDRSNEDLDAAEKAVVAYGGVQMGQLEKNVSWISLFIALAPMLGFMGTVIGMIQAFDKIEAAGDMQPSLVAGGIKVALLTTVFGLIVAIILQIFYNYIIAKIDSIVNNMEDASISLMDILVKNKK
jgi:biopolymer transport protein ExbB